MILAPNLKGGRHSEVDRKATYPVEYILRLIGNGKRSDRGRINLDGDLIAVNEKKHRMFKDKGCKCVKCGLEAKFFAKEMETHIIKNNNCRTYTLQLYGCNKDGEVIMTMDHIFPKSKGGKNQLYNLQPMCYVCNQSKQADMPTLKERFDVWFHKRKNNNPTILHRIIKFLKSF